VEAAAMISPIREFLWGRTAADDAVRRKTEPIANGRFKRLPVREYLLKQGRFAHFVDEDIEYFLEQANRAPV
jgi:pyruvate ferredoxin oxidoreductase beta subunit